MSFKKPQPGSRSPDQNLNKDKSTKNKTEKQAEEIKESLESVFVNAIIEKGDYVNEGNNGVIFKISLEGDGELEKALAEEGINTEKDQAAKLLKVYDKGAGQRELKMQKKARKIVQEKSSGEPLARIPEPNLYQDVELSDEEKGAIEKKGDSPLMGNNAEILLMDYVDGKDLYTWLVEEVAKQRIDELSDEDIRKMPFEGKYGLESEVHAEVGYKKPNKQSRGGHDPEHTKQQVFDDNATKLYKSLKKELLSVPDNLLAQIENTVDALHDSGYMHRDLHERNIMVDKNPFDDSVDSHQVFFVDFAEMSDFDGAEPTPDDYENEEGNAKYVQDKEVLGKWRHYYGKPGGTDDTSEISSPFTRIQ